MLQNSELRDCINIYFDHRGDFSICYLWVDVCYGSKMFWRGFLHLVTDSCIRMIGRGMLCIQGESKKKCSSN